MENHFRIERKKNQPENESKTNIPEIQFEYKPSHVLRPPVNYQHNWKTWPTSSTKPTNKNELITMKQTSRFGTLESAKWLLASFYPFAIKNSLLSHVRLPSAHYAIDT